ncbi:hypothetical protein FDUTEX481_08007 [Tolypothrix sp. PCC 7601]|nr:hypothetical protein FDUTEX481_08007 [Tolypothrix sp. PCC 7601]
MPLPELTEFYKILAKTSKNNNTQAATCLVISSDFGFADGATKIIYILAM